MNRFLAEVDNILRSNFKYKTFHNVSGDTYTIRILDETRQPDWFIFEDNKLSHLIEFQGEQHYTYSGSYFDNPKINDDLKDK